MNTRERNIEKQESVMRLNALKGHEACQTMIRLIDILVEEDREQNDHEESSIQIYRNQGGIQMLTHLKKCITDGYPRRPNDARWDKIQESVKNI